ncbi:MAG: Hsp20/alpha crystallin family protein [Candidatus Cloacimonadota bacterium]|nr:Hsp20/alpha crystallin family protein [Candidatus Cloacimonadota bacterium]
MKKNYPTRSNRDLFPAMSMFDNFLQRFFDEDTNEENERMMAIDVIEDDNNYVVKADLPGIKKDNINISVDDNELVIEAKHDEKKEEKKASYYRCERYSGNYRRSILLSENVDRNNIDAKFKDGVLEVTLPKREPKPVKKISVK